MRHNYDCVYLNLKNIFWFKYFFLVLEFTPEIAISSEQCFKFNDKRLKNIVVMNCQIFLKVLNLVKLLLNFFKLGLKVCLKIVVFLN